MNDFEQLTEQALSETIGVIGETIQFKDEDIPAIVSEIRVTEELIDGGILEKRGIKIVLKKSNFNIPAVGEKVIYSGRAYRIIEINHDSVSWELVADTDAK